MTTQRHVFGWACGLLIIIGGLTLVVLSCSARPQQLLPDGDEYVELDAPQIWSVATWTVAAGACTYTLSDDTIIDGRLVIWADQMLNYETGSSLPASSPTARSRCYDADAVVQDNYAYETAAMAKAWALVGGSWQQATPSPGR